VLKLIQTRELGMTDTSEQAYLRNSFIKEEIPRIEVEGIDVDEVYINEIVKRALRKEKILDIGTGNAHIPIEIAKRNRELEIIAIDLSKTSVKIAKKNSLHFENIHILRADGHNLPFKDLSFDGVIVRLAPHSIREAYRVLKHRGWYIHRACGTWNCWKEIREIFGERALPYATSSWWQTSAGRLGRLEVHGFEVVYEMFFLVKRYYTLNQIIKELQFNPIVKNFDLERDMSKLEELERKHKTTKGIRITGDPIILFGRKPTINRFSSFCC
jgi:ubiquinone/menaquinone biosynthesis C-methylase UbiE